MKCREIVMKVKHVVAKKVTLRAHSRVEKLEKGKTEHKSVPIPCHHSVYPNMAPSHPPSPFFTLRLVWLAFDQCLCCPSPRHDLGAHGTAGRAWFMHQCFLWMDLELEWTQALCVWQQWPVPATTDIQALREQIVKKGHWRESKKEKLQYWHLMNNFYWHLSFMWSWISTNISYALSFNGSQWVLELLGSKITPMICNIFPIDSKSRGLFQPICLCCTPPTLSENN